MPPFKDKISSPDNSNVSVDALDGEGCDNSVRHPNLLLRVALSMWPCMFFFVNLMPFFLFKQDDSDSDVVLDGVSGSEGNSGSETDEVVASEIHRWSCIAFHAMLIICMSVTGCTGRKYI